MKRDGADRGGGGEKKKKKEEAREREMKEKHYSRFPVSTVCIGWLLVSIQEIDSERPIDRSIDR